MSNLQIGFTALGGLLILLAVRFPIGAALGIVSVAGMYAIRGPRAAFSALGTMPFDFAASWTLSAVPMFILVGAIALHTGMTANIYVAARMWLHWLPGGVAIATNWACAAFGAVSGSSVATTAAMGKLAVPEMLRLRYDPALATSVVAASGTLGALIPPSLAFMIYGWYAEYPLAPLLIAGLVPGLLTAAVYSLMIYARCVFNPRLAPVGPVDFTKAERWRVSLDNWPLPVLILMIVGGMYSGVMTVTEAAACASALALLIGIVRRQLTWKAVVASLSDTARTTAQIFFIVVGAVLMTRFMAMSGVPNYLADWLELMGSNPIHLVLMMTVIFLILGMFLEPIGIMLLTLPILIPICRQLDMDLLWIGVLVVKYVEIGLITPPVGIQAFLVKAIAGKDVQLTQVFRGLIWFLLAEVVILTLLIAFPSLSTWLPSFF